ncbi:hydroxymethylglutaryl-coenzyme A reductase [Fusarium mundagurra]|uniref:Hydroxymethylglutaryl-coenzyme A reductase n=1 Tax=Fusarium mundagurra TaxID=1567541 RepID=A0A8H5YAS3_9HYPO|nr:hydroxymethylglutaryl-coenzyme A reductase [Fusarium mundagurra]
MSSHLLGKKPELMHTWSLAFANAGELQKSHVGKARYRWLENVYTPLATYEGTLVASCSKGCKAFNASGGIHIETLGNSISRGPVFVFGNPEHAILFAKQLPALKAIFSRWAEETSAHVQLQTMQPTVIGSNVHVLCSYSCGSAAGHNMVTKATQHACEMLRHSLADEFSIQGFLIEGQMASDKKPLWGNVKKARGVETLAWGTLTADACREVLGCTTYELYATQQTIKEGGIRNGQFGSNVNTFKEWKMAQAELLSSPLQQNLGILRYL